MADTIDPQPAATATMTATFPVQFFARWNAAMTVIYSDPAKRKVMGDQHVMEALHSKLVQLENMAAAVGKAPQPAPGTYSISVQ